MRLAIILAAGGAVAAFAGGLAVADTPDEIIATRQAGYKHIGELTKTMKDAVGAGDEVTQFAGPAGEIASWGHKLIGLFPAGTEQGHDTKARPEIWANKADFEAKAAAMAVEAEKLQTVAASGDKSAFAAQFKVLGGACYSCHQSYRYKS